jgi:DNA-binding CsgD family transcriptional regulator
MSKHPSRPAPAEPDWAPRDLWQLATEVTRTGRLDALRLPPTDPLVGLCREAGTARHAGDVARDIAAGTGTSAVWMAVAARLGGLRGDPGMCSAPCRLLAPHAGEFLVLGAPWPVGPAGWFIADALAALGHPREAVEVNAAAAASSRHLRAHDWSARCREQGERLRHLSREQGERLGLLAGGDAAGPDRGTPGRDRVPADPGAVDAALSDRQLEILRLAAAGLTNARIARRLFVSVATVERHCTLAYRALGVRNRAQALGVLDALRAPVPA